MLDMITDLGDGLQRPVILLGDVDSLHLLVHPGPLPGVALKHRDIENFCCAYVVDLWLKGREHYLKIPSIILFCYTNFNCFDW